MSEVCEPTFFNHHVTLFQECFHDWGMFVLILACALILPGLENVFYNLKLQYTRQALQEAIGHRQAFFWADVGYYAAFSFVNILSILFLVSNNFWVIVLVLISKITAESLFIWLEKADDVHVSTKEEQDILSRFIKKECNKELKY